MKSIWPYLRPFRGRFTGGVLLILSSTVVETLLPILVGRAVDVAMAGGHSFRPLYVVAAVYLGLIVVKAALEAAQAYVIQAAGQSVTHELRASVFARVQTLPVAFFDRNPTGKLVTRVVNDIKSLSELFTASISILALDVAIIIGTLGAMFWLNPALAALTLLSFPLVVITIHVYGGKLAAAYRESRARLSEINAFLGENIGAIATIQRLGAETERSAKFERIIATYEAAQMQTLRVFAVVQPIANILNGVATATLLGIGGYWVINGKVTLGVLVAFLGYLRNLFQPVRDLVEKYNTFLSAAVAAERVAAILDEKGEIEMGPPPRAPHGRFAVEFDDVSFRYPDRNEYALKNVSFHLPAGKSLAVVGATGSGKSTLVRLLLRYYDLTEGKIRFGGRDLTAWDRKEVRQAIGVVHQDVYLFQGTLRDNLRLGRVDQPDARLIEHCQRAQLWPYLDGRGGLDAPVLEGGTNFSLGERQLISFARVLVLDTPVLVLDEATSSVDRRLENRLMDAIHETLSGRTAIVIAHRLSTIRDCNSVIVLDHGHVEEEGSHEELMELGGLFAKYQELHHGS